MHKKRIHVYAVFVITVLAEPAVLTLMSFVLSGSFRRSCVAFGPAITWTSNGKSLAYRHIGPTTRKSAKLSSLDMGKCPLIDSTRAVGLWPKMPLNSAGTRIEPPTSDPMPNGVAPQPFSAPCG